MMRRQKMKIGELLRRVGDVSLYEALSDGEKHVSDIAKLTGVSLSVTGATGMDCLKALGTLSAPQREAYLSAEVDTDSGAGDMQQLTSLISQLRAGQSGWKTAVAVFMALLVGVMVITYAYLMFRGLPLPHWQDITCIIIVPGGIVWTWYGVLTKENRDIISAALGEMPKTGAWGAVIDAITRKRPVTQQNTTTVQQAPVAPPASQPASQSQPAASDMPDDNPPPGAANMDMDIPDQKK